MVIYACKTCGYTTTRKSSFNDHNNRKNPCRKVEFQNTKKPDIKTAPKKVQKCAVAPKNVQKCAAKKKVIKET